MVTSDSVRGLRLLRTQRPTSAPGEYGDEITTLKVQVPEGVDDGQVIRLRGKGHPGGGGGPPGDVLLEVKVLPHPLLRRKDRDLELDVPITIGEAVNGGKITVPTPWGAVNVNVPPMCRNGSRLRLRGKGVHGAGKDPGDLTLVLRPTPPSTPSDRARELAASFDELYDKDVRADLGF
jgi:DnaJ-class molecular chaperone